ncbi:MAG TPA: DegT/DnrJ/EryC1/StrS family aminotransferase [Polyangia bacterium]|nr:DegT/DnrJ/EryC1/StrS family aminotransferase [Polyangia bacterium]
MYKTKLRPGLIPVAGPSITDLEIAYVTDAVSRCWYEDANLYHERFQRAFAEYLGVKHALALPSCTSALHLAMAALGVGPGDEVIVPETTWIASAAPATYLGADPVFADVEEETWCLSVDSVARCLSPRTKAVVAVDLYGGGPDYRRLRALCEAAGVPIIEDAAQAVGSELGGRRAGSLGDVGTFSFHGSKTMTTGEGGMLVTDRDDVWRRVLRLQDHGQNPDGHRFFNEELGFKYKMSAMQAALGLAQLERIDALVSAKRRIFGWYREGLAGIDGLQLNQEPPGTKNSYWMVTVNVDERYDLPKGELMKMLRQDGIDTRPVFYPLSALPAFQRWGGPDRWASRNPRAYALSTQAINLPSALSLTREEVEHVCRALAGRLSGARCRPLPVAAYG